MYLGMALVYAGLAIGFDGPLSHTTRLEWKADVSFRR
jgi:hypothetical protein